MLRFARHPAKSRKTNPGKHSFLPGLDSHSRQGRGTGRRRGRAGQPARPHFSPKRCGCRENTIGRPSWSYPMTKHRPPARSSNHQRSSCSGSRTGEIGSSPLARGTHHDRGRAHPRGRFIPARAGNTGRGPRPARRSSVHPRSRGEHHGRADRVGVQPRFIPARAGNTIAYCLVDLYQPVHPRSRGEHDAAREDPDAGAGSSPLARGTPTIVGPGGAGERFIPARAGNTACTCSGVMASPVHPRSRGEHPPAPSHRRGARRFIPARAGNTHGDWNVAPGAYGSSPLARGTRLPRSRRQRRHRFIPARAGNTPPLKVRFLLRSGSSPLARGTPRRESRPRRARRFIPARAGNTSHARSIERRHAGSSPLARGTQSDRRL